MTDSGKPGDRRTDFLIEYYKVLWSNINRHIQGVWQTVTTLGGSIALLALVGDGLLSLNLAVTLTIGLCAWYASTAYDSALWFARNQVIATNIERLFLKKSDEEKIQPYFVNHRGKPHISHFKIAIWLSRGIVVIIVMYHLFEVVNSVREFRSYLNFEEVMPYSALVFYVVVECYNNYSNKKSYDELIEATSS